MHIVFFHIRPIGHAKVDASDHRMLQRNYVFFSVRCWALICNNQIVVRSYPASMLVPLLDGMDAHHAHIINDKPQANRPCKRWLIWPQNITKERWFYFLGCWAWNCNNQIVVRSYPASMLVPVLDGMDKHHAHVINDKHVDACIHMHHLYLSWSVGDLKCLMPVPLPMLLQY